MGVVCRFLVIIFILFNAASTWGAGAQQTNIDGIPYIWNEALVYNLDQGELKTGNSLYGHDQARQMVVDAFATWQAALNSGNFLIQEGETLPLAQDGIEGDVHGGNFEQYLNSNVAVNPIVFDEDGEIIDAIFGKCARNSLLAFAGFERLGGEEIEKGRAVFGGACIPDATGKTLSVDGCGPCQLELDEPLVRQMILHEVGHLLGMDHTQVNLDSYQECRALGSCPPELAEDIPTMFPIAVPGAAMTTLHADDIAYFNRLYGNPEFDGCSVSGKVLSSDGARELRGVEVVARNVKTELSKIDAMSFISGAEAPRFEVKNKSADNCKEGCGDYLITGLRQGETYQLCVQNILSQFTGASGIEPVDPPLPQVSAECFEDVQLTCTCTPGSTCKVFPGQDLQTQAAGEEVLSNLTQGNAPSAGGCSLAKPIDKPFWVPFKKLLVFHFQIQ